MTGARRVGKTELCRTLTKGQRAGWHFVRVDLEKCVDVVSAAALIEADLAAAGFGPGAAARAVQQVESLQIAGTGGTLRAAASADPWTRIQAALTRACDQAGPEGTFVLILDEVPWWLDALRGREGDAVARDALAALRHLRQRDDLVGRFRMLLTGSIGLAGFARQVGASAEVNDLMPPYDLRPLNRAAALTVFELALGDRRLRATPTAAAVAVGEAGGFPHWIKLIAERVAPAVGVTVEERDVADAIDTLLSPRLRNLFEDEGGEHLRRRHGPRRARTLSAVLSAAVGSEGAPFQALVAAAAAAENGTTRRQAEECVYLLADEYYLEESEPGRWTFLLPLLRRWWARYGEVA